MDGKQNQTWKILLGSVSTEKIDIDMYKDISAKEQAIDGGPDDKNLLDLKGKCRYVIDTRARTSEDRI